MKVNVSAIIIHQHKVLLIQRDINDEHFPGHWGIPGGGMEDVDVSLEATASREVLEEVGLHIVPTRVLFNNRFNDVIFIVCAAELADPNEFSEKLTVSDEIYHYEWADLDSLQGKKFTPFTEERLVEVLSHVSH
jgi:ADP-ribose pyrophosphatase YjhB (NUDIX family)